MELFEKSGEEKPRNLQDLKVRIKHKFKKHRLTGGKIYCPKSKKLLLKAFCYKFRIYRYKPVISYVCINIVILNVGI